MNSSEQFRFGYVAILGRPNVGKSTLLNHQLGQKISITSKRPQTTRHSILGIKTTDNYQIAYVDTPGIHEATKAVNRYMNRSAISVIHDIDVVIFVVDRMQWRDEDERVLEIAKQSGVPIILAINKIDMIEDKEKLLPYLGEVSQKYSFAALVPISSSRGMNLDMLEETVAKYLPQSDPQFSPDEVTDKSVRFLAAEIIREKLTRNLGKELPYSLTVEIEDFKEEQGLVTIHALIWVERSSQKAIVIGKAGKMLKEIGEKSRIDIERMLEQKVFLKLWVKVKEGWADDDRALKSLGYNDK
ncbi:GTPase Era [Solemya pervernicosa gill symbiont]|uniref:GTPase Era n=2 Tax=Gammaproteobacteria incertae sedis TaxID=118884 RepID=A0A1T2LA99_9GAMM|nr:GTPase Era [Candidatus Reidiella endopervernicosa]OOZ42029.1 GTPase Era [Solemya pervernicosa gill symbiont]QKQ27029.1 GTPase Era [Candidatus Reidiella endopervernicosa]